MAPSLVLVKGIRSFVGSNISCWGNAGFHFPSDLTSFINSSPRNAVPVCSEVWILMKESHNKQIAAFFGLKREI